MRPTGSKFFRLIYPYLMLRNMLVSLLKLATVFLHYASRQSTTHPATSITTEPPSQATSSGTTQGVQETKHSVRAVPTISYQLRNPSKSVQAIATQHQPSSTDSQNDYMLLCSDESGWLTTRDELNVSQIRSDRELFDSFQSVLKSRKCWARRFASLKTIQRISFVKVNGFRISATTFVHIARHKTNREHSLHSVKTKRSTSSSSINYRLLERLTMISTSVFQVTSHQLATDTLCIDFPTVLTVETAHIACTRFRNAKMGDRVMVPHLIIPLPGVFIFTKLLI